MVRSSKVSFYPCNSVFNEWSFETDKLKSKWLRNLAPALHRKLEATIFLLALKLMANKSKMEIYLLVMVCKAVGICSSLEKNTTKKSRSK